MARIKKHPGKKPVYKKGNIIPAQWVHEDYLDYWLRDFARSMQCQSILNVCSGYSTFGNVRVDISPESNRTFEGDMFKLLEYFPPNSFDLVYCDPDYKNYTDPNILQLYRNSWQYDLMKIAKKILITKRPKVNINMPSKWHDYVIAEDSRPSFSVLRIDYK
ncbi:MAG: hypothetical protein KGI08_09435 [Thaumarchaeota archaeon]|nr:hypothetical protein [Nitrososphaerota archaeon]